MLSILTAQLVEGIVLDMTPFPQPTKKAIDRLGAIHNDILGRVRVTLPQPRAQHFFAHHAPTRFFGADVTQEASEYAPIDYGASALTKAHRREKSADVALIFSR